SEHALPAMEQQGMIKGRVSGEPCILRQISHRHPDFSKLLAIRESVTGCFKSPEKTNEPRSKKRDADNDPERPGPLRDEILPQVGQHQEVSPEHQLEIVPLPGRSLDQQPKQKDCDGRAEESQIFR